MSSAAPKASLLANMGELLAISVSLLALSDVDDSERIELPLPSSPALAGPISSPAAGPAGAPCRAASWRASRATR
jgi:hypothetical protein